MRSGRDTLSGGGDFRIRWGSAALAAMALLVAGCEPDPGNEGSPGAADGPADLAGDVPPPPTFQVDEGWLPEDWLLGPGLGVTVDSRDHVWVSFRERGGHLAQREAEDIPDVDCGLPAPLALELSPEGEVVQMWRDRTEIPDWPEMLHGIYADHNDYLWFIDRDQHQIIKLTLEGEHVFTIGRAGETGGSDDTELLGRPSNVWVAPDTDELFVADGYGNRRIVVFDAETGEYLRHWGAYGEPPDDDYQYDPEAEGGEPPRQFSTAHGIIGSHDGLIYLADRGNDRIQVFQRDGTFVTETIVAPGMDFGLSTDPDQTYLYLADGNNHIIYILRRSDLEVVGEFGGFGEEPDQVQRPHGISVDSQGNLYTAEQADQTDGRRVQRFLLSPGGQP